MNTVPIKTTCQACQGQEYLPTGETYVLAGRTHERTAKCAACDGTGKEVIWIDLRDFSQKLLQAVLAETEQRSA